MGDSEADEKRYGPLDEKDIVDETADRAIRAISEWERINTPIGGNWTAIVFSWLYGIR